VRLAHGWRRRANNDDQLAAARAETFTLVEQALQQGEVRCYGRGLFRTYLQVKYHHNAREDDVRDALAALDAVGVESRRKGSDKRQKDGEYITPGPDWLWCCDGHDKFRNYGIEIYASVDAYSRRIQWCYVGNSNRRAVGILRQMVTAIKEYDRCPSYFRSDRGKEVLLLADAQFNFYIRHRQALGTCPDDEESLNLRECYMFGTSTANIRIESTWMRMLRHQTRPWLVGLALALF
jgi:rhodanese-related sulfurtransferase